MKLYNGIKSSMKHKDPTKTYAKYTKAATPTERGVQRALSRAQTLNKRKNMTTATVLDIGSVRHKSMAVENKRLAASTKL